jgi:hypothetical protein
LFPPAAELPEAEKALKSLTAKASVHNGCSAAPRDFVSIELFIAKYFSMLYSLGGEKI